MCNSILLYIASTKPSTKKLLSLVIPHVATKWYELGALLLSEEQECKLQEIKANFSSDVNKCCLEMFNYWRQSHAEANWYDLVEALQSPGVELKAVASDIKRKFIGKYRHAHTHICIT